MRMYELGFNYLRVSLVEEGLRGQGSPVAQQKGPEPPQKVMCLGVGAGRRRLISISSRLASNNDGSASVHPDTLTLIPQWGRDHGGKHQRGGGCGHL